MKIHVQANKMQAKVATMIQLISHTQVDLGGHVRVKLELLEYTPVWTGLKTLSFLHNSVKQHISQKC